MLVMRAVNRILNAQPWVTMGLWVCQLFKREWIVYDNCGPVWPSGKALGW